MAEEYNKSRRKRRKIGFSDAHEELQKIAVELQFWWISTDGLCIQQGNFSWSKAYIPNAISLCCICCWNGCIFFSYVKNVVIQPLHEITARYIHIFELYIVHSFYSHAHTQIQTYIERHQNVLNDWLVYCLWVFNTVYECFTTSHYMNTLSLYTSQ